MHDRPSEARVHGLIAAGRRDIQGLRAIAVLTVVAFHCGLPLPGGFVGVDVFFVISGFVITAMLQREWAAFGRIDLATFYLRRFKRLAPALGLVVAVTIVISVFVLSPIGTQQITAETAIGAVLIAANAVIAKTTGGYFDLPAESNPLLNIWSLSVEEQFYLVFPATIAICWKWSSRLSAPIILIGVAVLISFSLAVAGSTRPGTPLLIGFYSPVSRAFEFGVGSALALALEKDRVTASKVALGAGVLGIIMLGGSLALISPATPFPGVWTLLPVAGAALLIFAGSGATNVVTRFLGANPLVRIGDWSYSIYLWHWPLIVFASILWGRSVLILTTVAACSLIPAVVSYAWIERPIRNAHALGKSHFIMLLVAVQCVPILMAAGLWQTARAFFWQDMPDGLALALTTPTGWGNPECISTTPVSKRDVTPCQWGMNYTGAPIYLVGDSNAMHFSEAVRSAAAELRRPVTTLGSHGCPFIDVYLRRRDSPNFTSECREDFAALLAWLVSNPPGLVLIASVDRYWRDLNDYQASEDGSFREDRSRTPQILNEGLQRAVQRLQGSGNKVVLLQTIPHFIQEPYIYGSQSCSGWSVLTHECGSKPIEMPLDFADRMQAASRTGIASVAAATGATLLDFRSYFCPNGKCSTSINGTGMYMLDGYHLNQSGSSHLASFFVDALVALDSSGKR